ncbi:hypothetical protein [Streptomyces hygroscopicus]|uniref:hypothetical protein n=1 Tax=Streptomyces hygroscopicus TaxID=1912 RepID=UPI002240492C|nr:hypothetical protein [Streptomyces hygroscopicus]
MPTPVAGDVTGLHLPIEKYMLSAPQTAAYGHVYAAGIRACMRRFGFDYPVGVLPSAGSDPVQRLAVLYRRYGITDAAAARTWGYHLPSDSGASAPPALNLSQRAREVLLGRRADGGSGRVWNVPDGGCAGESARAIDGDTPVDTQPGHGDSGIVARVKGESFRSSLADERVKTAIRSWAACMKGHGYQDSDPLNAGVDMTAVRSPGPNAAEVRKAVTDVACKKSTNLTGIWFAVESQYQDTAIARHTAEIDRAGRARDVQAANVRRLLRRYGPEAEN